MSLNRFPIFTIGHSAHSVEYLTALLKRNSIEVVLDVRSSPFSGRAPQYNRAALKESLLQAGIRYSFGGAALGGRPNNLSMYVNGRADYGLMAQEGTFRHGLRRVANAARRHCVALLCAEAEPLECHRFLLVGRELHKAGIEIRHILANGTAESHLAAENRMLKSSGLLQAGFFDSVMDVMERAYASQASRFAFALPTLASRISFDSDDE